MNVIYNSNVNVVKVKILVVKPTKIVVKFN